MIRPILAALAFTLVLPAGAARAEGALAVGYPEAGPVGGFSYGFTVRFQTREEAQRRALEGCRNEAQRNNIQPQLCRLVAVFTDACFAVAMDPEPGTPGTGYTIARTEDDARTAALDMCRAVAGDRAQHCRIFHVDCDRRQ